MKLKIDSKKYRFYSDEGVEAWYNKLNQAIYRLGPDHMARLIVFEYEYPEYTHLYDMYGGAKNIFCHALNVVYKNGIFFDNLKSRNKS